MPENLDDEQRGRGDRCHKKQSDQDSKRRVRVIPSTQQIESTSHEQQEQQLRQDRDDDSRDDHLIRIGNSILRGARLRGSVSRFEATAPTGILGRRGVGEGPLLPPAWLHGVRWRARCAPQIHDHPNAGAGRFS